MLADSHIFGCIWHHLVATVHSSLNVATFLGPGVLAEMYCTLAAFPGNICSSHSLHESDPGKVGQEKTGVNRTLPGTTAIIKSKATRMGAACQVHKSVLPLTRCEIIYLPKYVCSQFV